IPMRKLFHFVLLPPLTALMRSPTGFTLPIMSFYSSFVIRNLLVSLIFCGANNSHCYVNPGLRPPPASLPGAIGIELLRSSASHSYAQIISFRTSSSPHRIDAFSDRVHHFQ